ncbi:MAG TPA: hypothetical protein VFI38_18830 [Candidatus Acidoferrum sp.]|nr:hypothetical protein [Candidatus Acidoferrum sp.]
MVSADLQSKSSATNFGVPGNTGIVNQWRELALVTAVLSAAALILWWRFLPLPHGDLDFYTEPAYLLARFGTLAGPGSQYVDLTYQKGIYNYPPGQFLLLAGWIKLFGLSPDSLLAYTHLIHTGILVLLYGLVRFRYGCSRLISSLTILSIFPKITHGRPDLPACLLSIAAWAALPSKKNWQRITLSGCLAGATLLVSPGFGVGIIATLFTLMLVNRDTPFRERVLKVAVWGGVAGIFFTSITAIVLWQQHSWMLAYFQFKTNMLHRGAQLNRMPPLVLYTYLFGILPFALVAILPAIITGAMNLRRPGSDLRDVTFAFLGGAFTWFKSNKSQLLLEHHFLFPAKSVFLAVLCSQKKFPLWLRVIPFLIITTCSFYLYKANFLYLGQPLRQEAAEAKVKPSSDKVVAVDSLYFASAYAPGRTLNYETVQVAVNWPQYLEALPQNVQSSFFADLPRTPVTPNSYSISAYAAMVYGLPEGSDISCTGPAEKLAFLTALGRKWKLPANPFALTTCRPTQPK